MKSNFMKRPKDFKVSLTSISDDDVNSGHDFTQSSAYFNVEYI